MDDSHFTPSKSKFGKWLDTRGIYAPDFAARFRIELNIMMELVYQDKAEVTTEVRTKLRDAIREIDPTMNTYDFWTSQTPDHIPIPIMPRLPN